MGYKSVSVLDIRSTTVTAIIGESGVNKTFIFKGNATEKYDGYAEGRFFSEESLKQAVYAVLNGAQQSAGERHKSICVGVPAAFTKMVGKDHSIAFVAPKKVNEADVKTLCKEGGMDIHIEGYEQIHSTALYYVTSDFRKVIDPTGIVSMSLQGRLSYIFASEYFLNTIRKILTEYGFTDIEFVPSSYVQAQYLLSFEDRLKSSILLDVGVTHTTISVVYGNGIQVEETYPVGEVNVYLGLHYAFEWDAERIEDELKKANINRVSNSSSHTYYRDGEVYPIEKINQILVDGIDDLCIPIGNFINTRCPTMTGNRPLHITGDGILGIKGATDCISRFLEKDIEELTPRLPYNNKVSMNSCISLLAYSLKSKKTVGFWDKLFDAFGK